MVEEEWAARVEEATVAASHILTKGAAQAWAAAAVTEMAVQAQVAPAERAAQARAAVAMAATGHTNGN